MIYVWMKLLTNIFNLKSIYFFDYSHAMLLVSIVNLLVHNL